MDDQPNLFARLKQRALAIADWAHFAKLTTDRAVPIIRDKSTRLAKVLQEAAELAGDIRLEAENLEELDATANRNVVASLATVLVNLKEYVRGSSELWESFLLTVDYDVFEEALEAVAIDRLKKFRESLDKIITMKEQL